MVRGLMISEVLNLGFLCPSDLGLSSWVAGFEFLVAGFDLGRI